MVTGIGEPAITVARSLVARGHVLATDISLQMLSIARQREVSENLEELIDFKEGETATMDLPESNFNVVLYRLGSMFLDDLDSGLSNIHKSLVNGGRFAASVWATSEKIPQLALAVDTVRKELDIQLLSPSGTPGPFSLADEDVHKNSFISCGFKDIRIERINITLSLILLKYTHNLLKI